MDREQYFYGSAGFSRFFRRSIDNPGVTALTLDDYARSATQQPRQINFDQEQVSGNMADVMKVGNISLDGTNGRISIFEGLNEVVRLGELDG